MASTQTLTHDPSQNHLLAALSAEALARIAPQLELVAMPLGEVLYESGGQLQHVYFPTTAIISLHYIMENGASAEISGVGNEGVLGISLFMGGNSMPSRAIVQTAGGCYRLKWRLMMEELSRASQTDHPLFATPALYASAQSEHFFKS
jgi:hypothetical protein